MEKTTATELLRIAIVGPESTGKSTLAEQLAEHYRTVFVPEYAREYIGKLKRPYNLDDIITISKGQMELEDKMVKQSARLLICDTNLLVTKIWAEHAYKTCPGWITETIKKRTYHLYLLTSPDIPWQADLQREHPHMREYLFDLYLAELQNQTVSYKIVTGTGKERLQNAITAINTTFPKIG